jgi:hypothetical protein
MSPFAILLRVLLSLSLILNGTGTAMAATRMLIDHAATSATKPVETTANVAAAAVSLPAAVVGRDANAGVNMPKHASSTLAHLLRPPIG